MSTLQAVSSNIHVPTTLDIEDYVVPTPPVVGGSWALSTRNFDSGTLGNFAQGSDAFTSRQYDAVYANDQSYSGSQSCQCNLTVGQRLWGGILRFPSSVGNGGKIYLEFYNRVPDYFDFDIVNGSMKYIVFSSEDSTGSPANARLHLQPRTGSGDRNFRWIMEGTPMSYQNYPDSGFPLKRNIWQKHNVEIGVGHIGRSAGGNAYVKHWIDGVLIEDNGSYRTINNSTHKLYEFKFLDYYNDTQSVATPECAPYARRMWIDNITLSAD